MSISPDISDSETSYHRLLRRQLRHADLSATETSARWAHFLKTVSDTYFEVDRERRLLENALEVNAQELTEANTKLQLFINNAPAGIAMLDRDMRYLFASQRWLEDHRVKIEDIVGNSRDEVFPQMSDSWKDIYKRCLEGQSYRSDEDSITQPDGSINWIRWEIHPWLNSEGAVGGLIVMSENITARKHAEEEMRIASVAFESRDGMMVTDARGTILKINQAFTNATGFRAVDIVGKTPSVLKSDIHHDSIFYRNMWEAISREGRWEGNIWNRGANGKPNLQWLSISAIRESSGKVTHYLGTYSHVSDPKEAERKILELAFYDPLTNLPNRRLFYDRLHQALISSKRSGQFGAILLLDLDHFKEINDTRGHDVGDNLLIDVAHRVRSVLREMDSAARLGGDEFIVLLSGLGADLQPVLHTIRAVAEKLRTLIGEPFLLDGETHQVTSSVGVALFSDRDESADSLIKHADLALYHAKNTGRNNICFFNSVIQANFVERANLIKGLRRAVLDREFILHYQPQVNQQGQLIGAEALLRWQPAHAAMIMPDVFIPIAEESGQIGLIGAMVLDMACDQLALWACHPGTQNLVLAVNISAHQFRQPNFVASVIATLERTGVRPACLKLEITESLLLEDVEHVIKSMHRLKQIGIKFCIDDFGMGYSSLTYIKRLPLDEIKIDKSFVVNLASDAEDRAIVKVILTLASTLNLTVTAEGVETEFQRDFLSDQGCQVFQGYLFGSPTLMSQMQPLKDHW